MNLILLLLSCLGAASANPALDSAFRDPRILEHLNDKLDCGNGRQVSTIWRCDGDDDCLNGADERDCDLDQILRGHRRRMDLVMTLRTEYPHVLTEVEPSDVTRSQISLTEGEREGETDSMSSLRNDLRKLENKVQNLTTQFEILRTQMNIGSTVFGGPRMPSTLGTFGRTPTTERRYPNLLRLPTIRYFSPGRPSLPSGNICGGTLTSPKGTITSPSYPESYPNNARCTWKIVAPRGQRITLTFNSLDLEEYCRDKISIHGSQNDLTICGGHETPSTVNSTGNEMTVNFTSDSSLQYRGFSASYSFAILEGETEKRDDRKECRFQQFRCQETQRCIPRAWRCDQYDDCGDGSDELNCPAPTLDPFSALFEESDEEDAGPITENCSYQVEAGVGNAILSPRYPSLYPRSARCAWNISTAPGQRIKLELEKFELEEGDFCRADRVTFYDGASKRDNMIIYMCGREGTPAPLRALFHRPEITKTVLSTSNHMFMTFKTDLSVQMRGFRITHSAVCGGELFVEKEGKILHSHSGFSKENYGANEECDWIIRADTDQDKVALNFETFKVGPPHVQNNQEEVMFLNEENCGERNPMDCYNYYNKAQNCEKDFVKVYDGANDTSKQIGSFCGNMIPPRIVSSGPALFLRFRSGAEPGYAGFSASYGRSQDDKLIPRTV